MSAFKGFSSKENDSVPVPAAFFTDLLPSIDQLGELRVSLYAFWNFTRQLKEPKYLVLSEMLKDAQLMQFFGNRRNDQEQNLRNALDRACLRGTLLEVKLENDSLYFINSPQGKAASEGLINEKWLPNEEEHITVRLTTQRPNIFTLYEQNIGPLTPLLSDTLQEAEDTYPEEWIEDAIKIAVTRNARNWRFVDAVLRSWKEKGRDGTDRKTSKEGRKRDIEGDYADYIEH
jgi:DnaD/phage-associated family protein